MLLLIESLKLVLEVALLSLAGQGLLGLLAGAQRDSNFFYRVLQAIGSPFVRLAGWIVPAVVLPRHHPLVAFLMLLMAWVGITYAKISHCLEIGVQQCR